MYENEIYSGDHKTDQNGASPYFDYTARPVEEMNRDNGSEEKKGKKNKEPGKKPGAFKKVMLSICMGLCFGLFAGVGFYGVQLATGQLVRANGSTDVITEVPENATTYPVDEIHGETATKYITYVQDDVSDMVEEVMPAMVSIVSNYVTTGMNFWGQTYSQQATGSGSGIIVGETDDELLIVTNNHVVEDSTGLQVTFIDETTAEAVVKGTDADMDLAVIAVPIASLSEDTQNAITIAKLGDSDKLKLGEPVVAIGNALGYGQSVTNGIVSALNREMIAEDGSTGTYIQTNAAINHGNSGGALLNINGEVIGINAARIDGSSVEGMGYAIPISSASPIIAELMERQTRTKVAEDEVGYIGISLQEVTSQISQMYNMPEGIYVVSVEEGSAAANAGIMKGDIITKFDGCSISSYSDLQKTLQYYAAGDSATITVQRPQNGEYVSVELNLILGSRPADRK